MSAISGDQVPVLSETRKTEESGDEGGRAAALRNFDAPSHSPISTHLRVAPGSEDAELPDGKNPIVTSRASRSKLDDETNNDNAAKSLAEERNADLDSMPSLRMTRDSLLSSDHSRVTTSLPKEEEESDGIGNRSASLMRGPPSNPAIGTRKIVSSDPLIPFAYHAFYWDCMELKSELIRLDFALRSIGSGGPLIKATHDVKRALMKLRDLYGMNTSALYPEDENVKMYNSGSSFAYLKKFPAAVNDFGDALDGFAHALHAFNNIYHDESLILRPKQKKFPWIELVIPRPQHAPNTFSPRFANGYGEDMEHAFGKADKEFMQTGIPAIQKAQNNMSSRYLNMTTIAFFLSGTTASMLQVTEDSSSSTLSVAVNSCLFSSLVFSVSSAVNSLLVGGWRTSIVRDPDSALPVWLRVWLNAGPMISLLVSGVFFAIGICLFVFTPGQHTWTSVITVGFTALHASGLMFLFGIFIQERWNFRRDAGPIGRTLTGQSLLLSGMEWMNSYFATYSRKDAAQISIGIMEAGRGAGTTTDDADKLSALSLDAASEDRGHSPGAIWHALEDEKFLLRTNFIRPQTPSGPPIPIVIKSRTPSPLASPQLCSAPCPLRRRRRSPLVVPNATLSTSSLPDRMTRSSLSSRHQQSPTPSLSVGPAETYQPADNVPSVDPYSDAYNPPPPLSHQDVTNNINPELPGRTGDLGNENQQRPNRLELPGESNGQARIDSFTPSDPDRVYTDDDDEDWEEISGLEGHDATSIRQSRSTPPQEIFIRRLRFEPVNLSPAHSLASPSLHSPDPQHENTSSPVFAHRNARFVSSSSKTHSNRPRRRRRRPPSIEEPWIQPPPAVWPEFSPSAYGNVRSAAMFLPNNLDYPSFLPRDPARRVR
ncbi:hypothetical protein ACEPAF_5720 [Sanghuangporus sanghuang]